jgi:hypothetical protein
VHTWLRRRRPGTATLVLAGLALRGEGDIHKGWQKIRANCKA